MRTPSILSSPLLQVYALRTVLLTSLIGIAFSFSVGALYRPLNADDANRVLENMRMRYLNLGLCLLCLLHHPISIIPRQVLPLALDVLLLLGEVGLGSYATAQIAWSGRSFAALFQLCGLFVLSFPRFATIWQRKSIGVTFRLVDDGLYSNVPWACIIFGRMFWRNYMSAESPLLRWIRTIAAIIIMGLLVSYAIYSIFIQPSEAPPILDHIHITEFYSRQPLHVDMDFDRLLLFTSATESLRDVLNITSECSTGCTFEDISDAHALPSVDKSVILNCPSILKCSTTISFKSAIDQPAFAVPYHHTADLKEVLRFSQPLILPPRNYHATAIVDVGFHRPLNNALFYSLGLGSFGFGLPCIIYPTPRVFQLLLQSDDQSELSTLRLESLSPHPSDYYLVTQVVTEHSILDGLAQLGGMWTIVEGFFVAVFGGSLLYFMFGSKPLARFGLVHLLCRRRVMQVLKEEFPRYESEGAGNGERGLVAFMREHFVNSLDDGGFSSTEKHAHLVTKPEGTELDKMEEGRLGRSESERTIIVIGASGDERKEP